jgi:hypothetical protein
LRIAVAVLAVVVLTTPAHAQRRRVRRARARAAAAGQGPEIGGHAGYNFDVKNAVVGAQASMPLGPLTDFYPSFDYYTISNPTQWGLNFDLKFRPPRRVRLWYLGTGLNLTHTNAAGGVTETNLNVLGGLEGRRGTVAHPFAEARLTIGHGSAFQLVGGLVWPLR